MMIRKLLLPVVLLFTAVVYAQTPDEVFIRKIADEILVNGKAYDNLRVLTKTIGARLAGSPQMYKAEAWGFKLLEQSGSEHTFKQSVMVPHWVRGGKDESVALLPGGRKKSIECDRHRQYFWIQRKTIDCSCYSCK